MKVVNEQLAEKIKAELTKMKLKKNMKDVRKSKKNN